MKPVFAIALKSFLLNAASCLLLFTGFAGVVLVSLSLLAQFITSIVFIVNQKDKLLGQGMLIGLGVFILIGFSVCTFMVFTMG